MGALIATLTIPLYGMLADRIGKRRLFMLGCVSTMLAAIPYFLLLDGRTTGMLLAAAALMLGLIWPMLTASLGSLFAESFPVHARYTGVTLGYQIGAALAGGTAPLIATLLLASSGGNWFSLAAYLIACGLISLIAVQYTPHARARLRRGD